MTPPARILLALSLATNAFLLAFVVIDQAWTESSSSALPNPAQPVPVRKPASSGPPVRVRAEDEPLPHEAVEALRAAGVNRQALIAMLLSDITRRSDLKLTVLRAQYAPAAVPDAEYRRVEQERQQMEERELRAFLGEGDYALWRREQVLEELGLPIDTVTEAEGDAIVRLRQQRQATVDEIQRDVEQGAVDPIDGAALQEEATTACEQAIARLLGPERGAPAARAHDPLDEWRQTYAALQPSDAQLAAVAAAEAAHLNRLQSLAANSVPDPLSHAGRVDALEAERQRALADVFGPEAYRQFIRGQDPAFQTLQRYAGPWQLSGSDIDFVYERVHELRGRVDQLNADALLEEENGKAVDWPALRRLADAERTVVERELETYLGGERFRRLHQNGVFHAGTIGR